MSLSVAKVADPNLVPEKDHPEAAQDAKKLLSKL
jgi:hypothetical protein